MPRLAVTLSATLLLASCFGLPGCHRKLAKLTAAGEHEEVVARVNKSRYLPRGKAARAWAESLEALGRTEEARAALQRDFRRGAHIESLVALADLERSHGLDGIAAAHYARVYSVETRLLVGRDEVCDLFRARARALIELEEAVAAHTDMRRVAVLCGEPRRQSDRLRDAALWDRIESAARVQVRGQRALSSVPPSPPATPRVEALSPSDLVEALKAELEGRAGVGMMSDATLRRLAGYHDWDSLGAAAQQAGTAAGAYALLRLSAIRPEAGEGKGLDAMRQRWATEAMGGPDAGTPTRGGWRAMLLVGDLAGAELVLSSALRAELPPAEPQPDGDAEPVKAASSQSVVPPPEHWSGKLEVDGDNFANLLALARLTAARGQSRRALAMTRWVLAEGHAAGLAGVEPALRSEVAWALEEGRPWSALAIAATISGEHQGDVDSVVASALSLRRAACEDGCGEQDDRNDAESLLGEAWAATAFDRLLELDAGAPPGSEDACPSLGELMAPDATGALAGALHRAVANPNDPALRTLYSRAIESEPAMWCAVRTVVPLMHAAGHRVTASKLIERLAHVPEFEAAGQFETHAGLALVAGDPKQAMLMLDAAAAISPEPWEVWRRAAELGDSFDSRDYELMAVRQLLLLRPEDRDLRRRLVLRQLRDLDTAHYPASSDAGRESIVRPFLEFVDGAGSASWDERESLINALAGFRWVGDGIDERLGEVVWGEGHGPSRHPLAAARLESALGGKPVPVAAGALGFGLATLTSPIKAPPGLAIARPGEAGELRLALARQLEPGPSRRRALVSVAVSGDHEARVEALAMLLAELRTDDAARADAVRDLLLSGPLAADLGVRPTPMLSGSQALMSLVFAPDLKQTGGAR